MFINFKCLLSMVLLFSLVMPAFSFEPSGGVLSLDGEDDYAILPFAEHGHIFPEGTHAFTVEVWFYPKAEPKQKDKDLILTQQVSIGLKARDKCLLEKNQLCSYRQAYLSGDRAHGLAGVDAPIEKDQWNYLAIIFKNSTLYHASNEQIRQGMRLGIVNRVSLHIRRPFEYGEDKSIRLLFVVLADMGEDKFMFNKDGQLLFQVSGFHGAIDAIRFSNIALPSQTFQIRDTIFLVLPAEQGRHPFDPPHRFFNDAHTLALWDFNDKEGADRFEDTSGNGKTLIGMNGAAVIGGTGVDLNRNPGDGLEIRPDASLTTTWGQVKSESF